jgi:pimeloyl-ACP methyl ester carboxylesterase
MGGAVALELAGSHPEKVSAVCLIDSVLFPSESFLSQMRQVECELAGPNFPEALIQVVSSLFLETDNRVTRAQILRKMGRVPKHVVLASFPSHLLNYNFTAAADACKVPELSNAG